VSPAAGWRACIDTGGTFTDCLAWDPAGTLRRVKVLSSGALRLRPPRWLDPRTAELPGPDLPHGSLRGFRLAVVGEGGRGVGVRSFDAESATLHLEAPLPEGDRERDLELHAPEEAPTLALRLVTGTAMDRPLPPVRLRLATTRGTNALLERRGPPVAFFVTRGLGDLLEIGTQQRPDLFSLDARRPPPLHATVVEVPGRLTADGTALEPLDPAALDDAVSRLRERGIDSAAVALLHADRHPVQERLVGERLRAAGISHISLSHRLSPAIGLLARAETAVADAFLAPVIGDYIAAVSRPLTGGSLHVMTSAGGLVPADGFHPKDSLLSGPAGGVVGAARVARLGGFERAIAFDMGGTSTDVCRIDGALEYLREHRVGDVTLRAPALAIETVAAGGGSICQLRGGGLSVGPESAGAHPGPACYGAGGPLTLTDANLLLGRLDPERFGIPVRPEAAAAACDALMAEVGTDDREGLLAGLLELANERMADAIRRISLRRGYDPAEYALVAFGGAGGQHACAVAERLGMRTVLIPPDAGLLSAHGLDAARIERIRERQVLSPLDEARDALPGRLEALAAEARGAVGREVEAGTPVEVIRRMVDLRFAGQESTLTVEWKEGGEEALEASFLTAYDELFGHLPEGRRIEVVALRVVAATRTEEPPAVSAGEHHEAPAAGSAIAWFAPRREVPTFLRAELSPGARATGPALVWEAHGATVIDPGWEMEIGGDGTLVLRRREGNEEVSAVAGAGAAGDAHEPRAASREPPQSVTEELFTQRFQAIVEEMGEQLRRTALSVNVRERLDFSCALLDPDGELVANAPHIPVHLGALGACVRAVRERIETGPGDMVVTNHPAYGGSHLPDVTVIAPAHAATGELLGYVANRAHHAEIGGSRPGSMPPGATTLAEEGVVISPMHLVRGGEARWERMRELLTTGRWPSRAVEENLADLRAAVAANRHGVRALARLADEAGTGAVAAQMRALTARAERGARAALHRLGSGEYRATELLDDGTPLTVRVRVEGGSATFDFAGSGPMHPGNLNATPAIVRSVVLYVVRLLLGEPFPLNEGLLRPIRIRIPAGILSPDFPDDPAACPAVVGGNVETSQRLTDTLLRALELCAGGQGTMNNVLFGNDRFGYYETIAGGGGAAEGIPGASAVQVHMTNTRMTDAEVLEHRYPVRVRRYAIRPGSGGAGRWPGGDGVVRELQFLAPLSLSVLAQHRVEAPYGLRGGGEGARGAQRIVRADGAVVPLDPADGAEIGPGDRLIVETPGGGGWGSPESG